MSKRRLILFSIALILQVYRLYKIYVGRIKFRNLVHLINKLSPLTPTQIVDKLKNSSIQSSMELCKGVLSSAESNHSFLNSGMKVLHSHLFEASNYIFRSGSKRLINKREPSHYIIKDNKSSINLYQIDKTIKLHTHIMRIVKTKIIDKVKRFFQNITNSHRNISAYLFNAQNLYEAYSPEGPEYIVLAKFSKQGEQICSIKPTIIGLSEKRIAVFLQNIEFKKTLLLSCLTIGSIICLSFICLQLYLQYKEYKRINKQVPFNILNRIFVKTRLCTICRKNLSCIVNKPCDHMITCQQCCPHMPSCLECKQQILEQIQYFAS